MDRGRNKQGILTLLSMGKSNRLRFSAGLDRKPEWAGAGLRSFYCIYLLFIWNLLDERIFF